MSEKNNENISKRNDEYERSLTTDYRARIWSRFVKALKEFRLILPNDHVCVCISGGKDSMLMAKLFLLLRKHSDFDFKVSFLVMDPGYKKETIDLIRKNIEILNIPAKFVETNIFDVTNFMDETHPCFLCAKMRRGALYNYAKEMGCNKIALGHHYDDVIETTLMNMLNSGSFQTMLPKLHSTGHPGMELIRPMYYIREKDIISWQRAHNLEFIQCACKFTDRLTPEEKLNSGSRRFDTKMLIKELLKMNPQVEKNIFKSASNVTLDMILGYKYKGKSYSFLDNYEESNEENNGNN